MLYAELRDQTVDFLKRWLLRLALTSFALALLFVAWNFAVTQNNRSRIATQNSTILSLERLLTASLDVETGMRGYVLVGEEEYLEPFRSAQTNFAQLEGAVASSIAASGGPPEALTPIRERVKILRAFSDRVITARASGDVAAAQALIASGLGKTNMDALRRDVGTLQMIAMGKRERISRDERRQSLILTALSVLFATLGTVGLGSFAWSRRELAKKATEELAGLGDRFRTLADNIPQLAWMADSSGNLYWYNQRWYDYTGLTPTDMAQDGWSKVHDPEYVEQATEKFMKAISSGETWQDTFPLRRHDGEMRWFLSMAQPIRNSRGDITRWFGTNTDVTEQREQEVQLAAARDLAEEANRAKSQFLANMSHELRTPLSAVIGYSEMLEEEMEELGKPELSDDLTKIKSNARHLLSLINDVLDISKIEANKMELYAETFEVVEIVRDVAATVGSLVEKKNNTLVVEADESLGSMHTDVVKLRQIIINLLSNAAKFTENGTITLNARREGDCVIFAIRDTGLGMTPDQVAKLFQRFSQADVSTTRRFGGTGLGLAITKAFSDMLGGQVNVTSDLGVGSTFEVRVPASLPEPASETGDVVVESDEDVVLIIDDDAATRDLLSRFLKKEGFHVRVAADGQAGLSLAQTLKPHVILLDVTMPRLDGWSVLRSLKNDPHLAAVPVVMVTVIDEQNLGFSLGASDYLLKPVDWDRLRDVLNRVQKDAAKGDVLVIDDDADTRDRLNGLLSKNGWTVTEADNGHSALAAARLHTPSLVLLDLNMPEMDGFTFFREFRGTAEWHHIPVVVMTARDLSEGERAELKGGGAKVLSKGAASMSELVEQLRVLRPKRARAAEPEAVDA